MGIGVLEFGSGITKFPDLVMSNSVKSFWAGVFHVISLMNKFNKVMKDWTICLLVAPALFNFCYNQSRWASQVSVNVTGITVIRQDSIQLLTL